VRYERDVLLRLVLLREPERPLERLLLEPPLEPADERLADVDAAFAPDRAPVAAALVARRAPDAALRAVLRAVLVAEVLLRFEVLPRFDELLLPRERDDEDDDELLRELDAELLPRVRLEDVRERVERRRVVVPRWSRGISFLTRSLISCGMSFSR
jgi:hypothetical protein